MTDFAKPPWQRTAYYDAKLVTSEPATNPVPATVRTDAFGHSTNSPWFRGPIKPNLAPRLQPVSEATYDSVVVDRVTMMAGQAGQPFNWRAVLRRDPCAYCGGPGGTVDHLDTVSAGGPDVNGNLTSACKTCNGSRGTMTVLHYLRAREHARRIGRWLLVTAHADGAGNPKSKLAHARWAAWRFATSVYGHDALQRRLRLPSAPVAPRGGHPTWDFREVIERLWDGPPMNGAV